MDYRIFIVEDDKSIAGLLQKQLAKWGFEAKAATDFAHITEEALQFDPHLILLDISLPQFDGFHWCTDIRKHSETPIVFISSRTDNMDIVMAIRMGGDDYITKPFSIEVLIAKIQAVLRRTYEKGQTHELTCGGVKLRMEDACLVKDDRRIELTKNEYRILWALFLKKNTVVSREELMRDLWESDEFIDDNTLTVNINRLRKHLADEGVHDLIQTRKGLGYVAVE